MAPSEGPFKWINLSMACAQQKLSTPFFQMFNFDIVDFPRAINVAKWDDFCSYCF